VIFCYFLLGKPGCSYWWDDSDFSRNILFISNFVQLTNKRIVFWQIPFGNTIMKACDNTLNHYQDNRPQWLLGNPLRTGLISYRDVGVIAFLFGCGNGQVTCACDQANDGITNPNPIDGNSVNSLTADDDGGYFFFVGTEYNQQPEPLNPGNNPPITASYVSLNPNTQLTPNNGVGERLVNGMNWIVGFIFLILAV